MIFLYIAIAWIALIVLFVILWARFAGRRHRLASGIEQDRRRAQGLRVASRHDAPQPGTGHSEDPGDVA